MNGTSKKMTTAAHRWKPSDGSVECASVAQVDAQVDPWPLCEKNTHEADKTRNCVECWPSTVTATSLLVQPAADEWDRRCAKMSVGKWKMKMMRIFFLVLHGHAGRLLRRSKCPFSDLCLQWNDFIVWSRPLFNRNVPTFKLNVLKFNKISIYIVHFTWKKLEIISTKF